MVGGDEPTVVHQRARGDTRQMLRAHSRDPGRRTARGPGRSTRCQHGLPSCCGRPKAGPARPWSMVSQWLAHSEHTKCRSWRRRPIPRSSVCWKSGCRATSRRHCSRRRGRSCRSWRHSPRQATAHGRQPARERREGAEGARSPGLPRRTRSRCRAALPCDASRRVNLARWCVTSSSATPLQRTSASPVQTRPIRTGCRSVFEVENRCLVDRRISIDDHVSGRWPRHGGTQRASLRRVARGVYPHRPSRAVRRPTSRLRWCRRR